MSYVICIPSYRRAAQCNAQTLALLSAHGIDPQRIYVYVVEEERGLYEATLDRERYKALVVGEPGIMAQREFISEQWPEGTDIVSIDDDIRKVVFRTPYPDLHTFFCEAFAECRRQKAYIWGVHPLGSNEMFMRAGPEISTDLRYIVGAFYGYINRRDAPRYDISRQFDGAKDDVELSILYYLHDGVVVRFNRVGIVTKYFGSGGQGGIAKRREAHAAAAEQLAARYPGLGFLRRKSNGILDFTLRAGRGKAQVNGAARS